MPGGGFDFFWGAAASGKTVNPLTAMQTSVVYACVRILAETVASLPLNVYKFTAKGRERADIFKLHRLLHSEPNPEMTSFTFRETLMTHLLLWGNAYAQILRDGRGEVLALYPLMPDQMQVTRGGRAPAGGELVYTYTGYSGEQKIFSRDHIMHITGLGFDGLLGYSPIAMAKQAIGTTIAAEEYGSRFFANGAVPSGVLEHPAAIKDPERVRAGWTQQFGGSVNSGKVAVLEEGMKFHTIGLPPEQSQFLETRKFQLEEICRIFRVPPHLIADLDKATFSNIEHQSISFVVNTIVPWVTRLEQAMNMALLSETEKNSYFVGFVIEGLLRGDYQSRMQGYSIGVQNGFLSPNDVRELENMNLIDGGDVYMVNGSMTRLESVGAAYGTEKQGRQ
jgi:HK97 family phage portal protein